ncbi:SpaA isopeptide-forming pilin-related protein [Bifidobacterium boum]|uniref:SpaA isopeptide-forming pilin-related protein n=1 Tax=Bifidobacterium boum TaxID=78343 RepID=UPI00242F34A7|nr:SpaA isopeptide-forming pilin-related protein [Bifidobacterium boum]MCI5861274.1 LPXTG cell wall anchor domain-containing protein [Bifidobacterium boum]
MKTSLKRFFAGVAAAAMAVGGLALGATSAQAAGPVASTQTGSLTVKAANGTTGHTLKAYLVAAYNSDYQAASDGSLNFDTFKYVVTKDNGTKSNDESAVKAALTDAGVKASASGSASSAAEEGLRQLTGQSAGTPFGYTDGTATASAAERKFADALAKKLTATDSTKWTPSNVQDLTPGDGKFTADLNPEGLYLVVDTYAQKDGSKSTQSVPMLVGTKFANAAITTQPAGVGEVDMKNVTVPVHKEVVTDNTGKAANNTPSYNIGDTVYFHLSTTIPDYSGYAADPTLSDPTGKTIRQLNLDDEFEAGKFTGTKVVSVKDATTAIGDQQGVLENGKDYDVTGEDTDTVTVDLKRLVNGADGAKTGWKTGDVIDVIVSGVLSADATTTDKANTDAADKTGADSNGNSNKVTLNYSNNPKDNSQQNKVPGDTVNVYSFNLNVHKVNQDNNPLGGAEFKIVDKADEATPLQFTVSGSTYTHAKKDTDGAIETLKSGADGSIAVKGLKAGTYVVTETKAPAGFFQGALPSYTVTIAEHYTNDKTNTTRTSTKSGDDWLDTLTYSNTPDNYGLVTKDATSPSTWTVKNVKSITQLPKTGAAGIAFFSVIGVAVVALAALFAVRARKASRLA